MLGGVVSDPARDRRRPIGLNLGERQCAAVDPDFVEHAAEGIGSRCRLPSVTTWAAPSASRAVVAVVTQGAIHIDFAALGAVA